MVTLDVRLGEVLVLVRLLVEAVDVAFDRVESSEVNNWQLRRWNVARSGRHVPLPFRRLVLMLLVL